MAIALGCKGLSVQAAYRFDLLVAGLVVIELKGAEKLTDIHEAEIPTYLKCGGYRTGRLLDSRQTRLVDG